VPYTQLKVALLLGFRVWALVCYKCTLGTRVCFLFIATITASWWCSILNAMDAWSTAASWWLSLWAIRYFALGYWWPSWHFSIWLLLSFFFRRFMLFFGAEGKRTVAYTQLGQISTLFGYLLSALEILDMLWRFWTLSFGDLGHALEILDFIIWRSWTCFGDFGLYHLEILDMLWRFWTLSWMDLITTRLAFKLMAAMLSQCLILGLIGAM